jgi:CheY-like chemotaxis protein
MSKHADHGALRSHGTGAIAAGLGDRGIAGAVQRPSGAEPERRGHNLRIVSPADAVKPATGVARVLVINDDSAMRQTLVDALGACSLSAIGVCVQQGVLPAVSHVEPDLILLNAPLEQDGGLRLLRDIRSVSDAPIVVTAHQERDEVDRIVALELGADDYLDRSVSMRELMARIRAILRRCEIARNPATRAPDRGGSGSPDGRCIGAAVGSWLRTARSCRSPRGNTRC